MPKSEQIKALNKMFVLYTEARGGHMLDGQSAEFENAWKDLETYLLKERTESKPTSEELDRLTKENAALKEAIRKVIEEDVQEVSGLYSRNNNKCKHGHYGYEDCENCVIEFLEAALKQAAGVK